MPKPEELFGDNLGLPGSLKSSRLIVPVSAPFTSAEVSSPVQLTLPILTTVDRSVARKIFPRFKKTD